MRQIHGVERPTSGQLAVTRGRRVDARDRQVTGLLLGLIYADFLAGANFENNNPKALLFSLNRLIEFLPRP
jgi:hypothetical protein